MEGYRPENRHGLVGRERELALLKTSLTSAMEGEGSTMLISGEAGIGKTWLIEEFIGYAREQGSRILSGSAAADTLEPFLIFSRALQGEVERPLFHEQEHTSFTEIFAVDRAGLLLAQASPMEGGLDADIFAGMLSAVQSFVKDSFDAGGARSGGLGRLEYGDMKIMMEHGEHLFLTAVFRGVEHHDMRSMLKRTIQTINREQGHALENWSGTMKEIGPVQEIISSLASVKFLVRRELEGVMLENERTRIADQALDILVEIARPKPLIIMLEDMHWADESSLFVFNYLARNIRSEKILIMGSMRPHESDVLAHTLESMREEGLLTEIELEMFDIGDVSSLVKEMYPGSDFSDDFINSLASQCKGNPFFMTELLRQMGVEGSIGKKDDKYLLLSEDYSIPSSVEDMVYNRLEKMEPDTMMLVEYASCIGRKFEDDIVKSIQTLGDTPAALNKLNETGIIISSDNMNEFSHAIFRDVIYDSIGARWRLVYHKSLGEFYEVKYSHQLDEVLYELARHFSASNEFQKAFDYSIRAGEKAESAFAPEQGITFYEKALEILPRLKMGLDAIDKEIELKEWLGDLYAFIGNYESAFEKFDIGEEVKCESDTRARLLRKVGYVHQKTGNYDGAIETAGRAKELLGDTNYQEQGRILVGEGSAYWRKGEYDNAMKHFIEAYDTFEKVDGADEDSANALRMVGNIYISQGEKEMALEYSEKSLALMENIGNLPGIASALNNIGIVHRRKGELDKALEYQTRGLEIRKKIMDKRGIAFSLINMGNLNWDRGDLDTALQNYESSLEIMETIGDRHGTGLSLSNIGLVHMNRGDMDLALDFQAKSLEIREKIKDKHGIAESLYNIALLHLASDNPDLAREYFEKCLDIYLDLGDKRHTIQSRCGLAEASMKLGKVEEAFDHGEKALADSLEIGLKREEGMSLRTLGMIHREKGDMDKAGEEFEKARTILEEVGEKTELAYLLYEYALLLKARDESTEAEEYLEQARDMFGRMGMKLWVNKAGKVLAELK